MFKSLVVQGESQVTILYFRIKGSSLRWWWHCLLFLQNLPGMSVCIGLLGLSEQGATNWEGWNNTTGFSGSPGGQKSRVEAWAGRYPRGGSPKPSSRLPAAAPSPVHPGVALRRPRPRGPRPRLCLPAPALFPLVCASYEDTGHVRAALGTHLGLPRW